MLDDLEKNMQSNVKFLEEKIVEKDEDIGINSFWGALTHMISPSWLQSSWLHFIFLPLTLPSPQPSPPPSKIFRGVHFPYIATWSAS